MTDREIPMTQEKVPSKTLTPAMAQWFTLKEENKDSLLFFRMGDFYELFFDDAVVASSALDIVLTGRGKFEGKTIPMCGVPLATAPAYLAKLVRRGFRVAIAEQTETPSQKTGNKGPLKRHVVRLVTPGTLTEEELLDPARSNFLMAIAWSSSKSTKTDVGQSRLGAAWIDVSTGYFATQEVTPQNLLSLIAKLDPAEIVMSEARELGPYDERVTVFPLRASQEDVVRALASIFKVADLSAYGTFSPLQLRAALIVARYVEHTQAGILPHLLPPSSLDKDGFLHMDPSTRLSLDIITTRGGEKEHTLFDAVDETVSAPGARLLSSWLASPLLATQPIDERQQSWLWLREHKAPLENLRHLLKRNPDMMRALGRISFKRDLRRSFLTIAAALDVGHNIVERLGDYRDQMPKLILEALKKLETGYELSQTLKRALIVDGQDKETIISSDFDEKLANYRNLKENSQKIAASLQEKYASAFSVPTLKIRHHMQMGFVLEVPVAFEQSLRTNYPQLFFRKGTKNAARFATQELVDLNLAITQAQENAERREEEIVDALVQQIMEEKQLPAMARALSLLDVFQSCAVMGSKSGWCQPIVTDDVAFELQGCRHPVVEAALPSGSVFVPNDCDLSPQKRMMLLTGPNMAGKSTYLRQLALIVILAQSGLPISADQGRIGIVDQLFSRVGAADDLVRGQSTFMVEMTETAAILNQAGPRSFVVVDEIGRGTATFDGLAIAQAVLENLHTTIGCRGIFATHFHELARASSSLPRVCLYTMAVREWKGKIIFLHEVIPGDAKRSWGVHVADLAGVPKNVVWRAAHIVKRLEEREKNRHKGGSTLPLFENVSQQPSPKETTTRNSPCEEKIRCLDLDGLTPKNALDILYELSETLRKEGASSS